MSERGLEALSDVWGDQGALTDVQEWSASPPGCPGVVRRPSLLAGVVSSLPNVQEWLRGSLDYPGVVRSPPKCPREVGRPYRMSGGLSRKFGSDRRPSWMSGSGRESLPNVQECLGVPPGCPGVVGSPFLMSGSGHEALPDVREWSKGPPKFLRVVGRPFLLSGNGREALHDVREWSGGPPGFP